MTDFYNTHDKNNFSNLISKQTSDKVKMCVIRKLSFKSKKKKTFVVFNLKTKQQNLQVASRLREEGKN